MRTPQLFAIAIGLAAVVGVLWASGRTRPAPALPPPVPGAVVVAELFTSEGCSSCPPADELLTRLVREQPLPGVTILGLAEHVDYWNDLGWTDPFSSADYSRRQSAYLGRLPSAAENTVYTPQMVIDGASEAVGSDSSSVTRKIAQAAAQPKAALQLTLLPSEPGSLQLQINLPPLPAALREPSDLLVAVTENHLTSNVGRGENSGRRLQHNGVVRSLHAAAALTAGAKDWSGQTTVTIAPEWKPADLKVIAFLQEHRSRRIIAVGWTQLAPAPGSAS